MMTSSSIIVVTTIYVKEKLTKKVKLYERTCFVNSLSSLEFDNLHIDL